MSTLRRASAAATLAWLLAGAPSAAGAVPVLDEADAADLAASLAEATEVQGICYGWAIELRDQSGTVGSGTDVGSGAGVGVPADSCPRHVVLEASILWTAESSESEDSATFAIRSNLAHPPSRAELEELGVSAGALAGERGDEVVANAVLALPALVAASGAAPPVIAQPDAEPMPAEDGPTRTPGSDFLRRNVPLLVAGAVVTLAGAVWCGLAVASAMRERGGDRGSAVGPGRGPGGRPGVQRPGPGAAGAGLRGGGPADPG